MDRDQDLSSAMPKTVRSPRRRESGHLSSTGSEHIFENQQFPIIDNSRQYFWLIVAVVLVMPFILMRTFSTCSSENIDLSSDDIDFSGKLSAVLDQMVNVSSYTMKTIPHDAALRRVRAGIPEVRYRIAQHAIDIHDQDVRGLLGVYNGLHEAVHNMTYKTAYFERLLVNSTQREKLKGYISSSALSLMSPYSDVDRILHPLAMFIFEMENIALTMSNTLYELQQRQPVSYLFNFNLFLTSIHEKATALRTNYENKPPHRSHSDEDLQTDLQAYELIFKEGNETYTTLIALLHEQYNTLRSAESQAHLISAELGHIDLRRRNLQIWDNSNGHHGHCQLYNHFRNEYRALNRHVDALGRESLSSLWKKYNEHVQLSSKREKMCYQLTGYSSITQWAACLLAPLDEVNVAYSMLNKEVDP